MSVSLLCPPEYRNIRMRLAAFSGDGRRVLTVYHVGCAEIWDVGTGTLLSTIHPTSPLAGSSFGMVPFQVFIESAVLDRTGAYALLGLNDGTAGVFHVATGERCCTLARPAHPPGTGWQAIHAVIYSPDGAWIAVGFPNRTVGIWNAVTFELHAFLHDPHAHRAYTSYPADLAHMVIALVFSSRQPTLCVQYADHTAVIWEYQQQIVLHHLHEYAEEIIAVDVVGPRVLWATSGGTVWAATPDPPPQRLLTTHEGWTAAFVRPALQALMTMTLRHTWHHWPLPSWLFVQPSNPPEGAARADSESVTPVPGWIYDPNQRASVRIMEPVLTVFRPETSVVGVMDPSGHWMAVAANPAQNVTEIQIRDGQTGKVVMTHTVRAGAQALAWSPNATLLAIGMLRNDDPGPPYPIYLWEWQTDTIRAVLEGHTHQVRSLAFAPDGTWLVSAGFDRTVRLWEQTEAMQWQPTPRRQIAYDDLNTRMVTVLSSGEIVLARQSSIEVWDRLSERIHTLAVPYSDDRIIYVEQSTGVVTVTTDQQRVDQWDLRTGTHVAQYAAPILRPQRCVDVALTTTLFPLSDGRLWDLEGGPYLPSGQYASRRFRRSYLLPDQQTLVMLGFQGIGVLRLGPPAHLQALIPTQAFLMACWGDQDQVVVLLEDGAIIRTTLDSGEDDEYSSCHD
jgi:WD40 repeat protein